MRRIDPFDPSSQPTLPPSEGPRVSFCHEGLQEIYLQSQREKPHASPSYIKVSDEAIRKHLEPSIIKGISEIPRNQRIRFEDLSKSLAETPTYTIVAATPNLQYSKLHRDHIFGFLEQIETTPSAFSIIQGAGIPIGILDKMRSLSMSDKANMFISSGEQSIQNDLRIKEIEKLDQLSQKDKVTNRDIAQGYFPQPGFIDGRYIHTTGGHCFEVLQPMDLFNAIPKSFFKDKKGSAILYADAYVLIRDGDNVASIPLPNCHGQIDQRLRLSAPPEEARLIAAIFGRPNTAQDKLKSFFQKLQGSDVRFLGNTQIESKDDNSLSTSELAQLLLSLREPVYIKGSNSSGGRMILKLGFEPSGEPYLETSSQEILQDIEYAILKVEDIQEQHISFDSEGIKLYPEQVIEQQKTQLNKKLEKNKISVESLLTAILTSINNPIIEQEIPFETLKNQRVEFRVICQIDESNSIPHVVADYCKMSGDPVAANISIAGHGAFSEEVIRGLYLQRLGITEADSAFHPIDENVEKNLSDMREMVNKFAKHYFEKTGIKSFVVDLVPVWNQESSNFEFWLLEFQDKFAFSGLEEIDPEMAASVRKRLEEI
jgi:hypothetical protein